MCAWLDRHRPDILVAGGDIIDFPSLSSYSPKPEHDQSANECIQSGYEVLRDWSVASGSKCKLYMLPGNHEQRLQKYVIRNAPELYGLHRADDDTNMLALPHLLRLDELGYEWVAPKGLDEWPHSKLVLGNNLVVTHGWLARKGSGMTAKATLEHMGHSVVVGHTHRQGEIFHSYEEIDGSMRVLTAAEAGTLCDVKGQGYSVGPDWQAGFATAWVWPDGKFYLSLAHYVNGTLLWGRERYG